MIGLALVSALAFATPDSPAPPDREPPPELPHDPYGGLAPIEQDPFETASLRESRTWIFVSAGLGGGSARLGPLASEAAAEGHFFVFPSVSIGARLGVAGFGEPDGNGASGRFLTGLVGYRFRLAGDQSRVDGPSDTWLHLAVGAGWIGLNGYDKTLGQRTDFDLDRLLVAGRIAVIWARGVFGASVGLDILGVPGEGFAVLPTPTFGFLF